MLAELTPFATEYRYPGKVAEEEDAEKCIEMIRKLRDHFRPMLNVGGNANPSEFGFIGSDK